MTKRFLTKADGTRLRGDRQFASNQVFRTRFRNCPRDLTVHVARGFRMILKAVRFLAPWFGAHVDTTSALPTMAGIIAS